MTALPDTTLSADEALAYAESSPSLAELCERAMERAPGPLVTFSPKVFIPLTHAVPRRLPLLHVRATRRGAASARYLTPDEVLAIAAPGRDAGCHEALFTLGDKPELRYRAAREELAELGLRDDRVAYLVEAAPRWCCEETGLLPHVNPGILDDDELARRCATVAPSQGIMLETASATGCRSAAAALRLARQGCPRCGWTRSTRAGAAARSRSPAAS